MHIWKHFSTITRHRHKVIVHCFMAGIFWQGLRHDLSKYSPAEFIPGAKIISVIKVQMKKRGNGTAFRVRGFIIRDAINTILNTGLITIRS